MTALTVVLRAGSPLWRRSSVFVDVTCSQAVSTVVWPHHMCCGQRNLSSDEQRAGLAVYHSLHCRRFFRERRLTRHISGCLALAEH